MYKFRLRAILDFFGFEKNDDSKKEKEAEKKALKTLRKVLNFSNLGFDKKSKEKAIDEFSLAKFEGASNQDALKRALLKASGKNKKLFRNANKALKIKQKSANADHASMSIDEGKEKDIISTTSTSDSIDKAGKHEADKEAKKESSKSKEKEKDVKLENREWKFRTGISLFIAALVLVLVIFVVISSCKTQPAAVIAVDKTTTTVPAVIATSTTTATATTWKMVEGDYGNNRWFTDGIVEIKAAKTDKDAVKAAFVWLDKVKRDPNLLAATVKYFLKTDVDKPTLVKDGWATDKAVQLVTELELVLGQAQVTLEKAPKKGFNTGVDGGQVVKAKKAVITGDRSGIRIDITLLDGKVISFWIMSRCGNIVTKEEPELPIGKTDNPETPTTTTTVPTTTTTPPTTTTLEEKSDDPNDYQSPDDKPLVPEVTTPPESTPPIVITIEVGGSVTETPTNDPGSETGVNAPGSTPTETTSTPTTEAGVNPPNNGTNTGDPGSPF